MKEICAKFGRYLWWSTDICYVLLVDAGLQALGQLTHVAADLLAHLIVDSQLLHLPPDLLLIFSLSWTKYACSVMANDTHFSWRSPTIVRLKEVTNKFYCSYCPHGSIALWVTVGPCICPHSNFLHKCYSSWLTVNSGSIPDAKITALNRLLHKL